MKGNGLMVKVRFSLMLSWFLKASLLNHWLTRFIATWVMDSSKVSMAEPGEQLVLIMS